MKVGILGKREDHFQLIVEDSHHNDMSLLPVPGKRCIEEGILFNQIYTGTDSRPSCNFHVEDTVGLQ